MTMVLLAMIPKLVEMVLLHVFSYMRGFCQIDKGSAGADPSNYKGGSARLTLVLLAMIPTLVERVLLHVLSYIRGVLPERQRFCWS